MTVCQRSRLTHNVMLLVLLRGRAYQHTLNLQLELLEVETLDKHRCTLALTIRTAHAHIFHLGLATTTR